MSSVSLLIRHQGIHVGASHWRHLVLYKVYVIQQKKTCVNDTTNSHTGTSYRSRPYFFPVFMGSRRPISRVKARTSRQGLPVDDEDDVDEEEPDSMLLAHPLIAAAVGPAEPTISGNAVGDPWKNNNISRPHPSGDNDIDGVTPLEVHPVKGRKGKGEGVKFTPPIDREPWTKVERTSNQHSVQELPSVTALANCDMDGVKAVCILPFLRQLHAATPNGDPCLRRCGPVDEREVWTCGQNSYGELGHSDTGTRKVHCLVKTFEGREAMDIAAGNLRFVRFRQNMPHIIVSQSQRELELILPL